MMKKETNRVLLYYDFMGAFFAFTFRIVGAGILTVVLLEMTNKSYPLGTYGLQIDVSALNFAPFWATGTIFKFWFLLSFGTLFLLFYQIIQIFWFWLCQKPQVEINVTGVWDYRKNRYFSWQEIESIDIFTFKGKRSIDCIRLTPVNKKWRFSATVDIWHMSDTVDISLDGLVYARYELLQLLDELLRCKDVASRAILLQRFN